MMCNPISSHEIEDCINVEDLIKALEKYPKGMKCVFTWESVFQEFKEENIYVGNHEILLFDSDMNTYKADYENGVMIEP